MDGFITTNKKMLHQMKSRVDYSERILHALGKMVGDNPGAIMKSIKDLEKVINFQKASISNIEALEEIVALQEAKSKEVILAFQEGKMGDIQALGELSALQKSTINSFEALEKIFSYQKPS